MKRMLFLVLALSTSSVNAQEVKFTLELTSAQLQTVVDALQEFGPYKRVAPALHDIMKQAYSQPPTAPKKEEKTQ
jgi:hypothetical protein